VSQLLVVFDGIVSDVVLLNLQFGVLFVFVNCEAINLARYLEFLFELCFSEI